jgi:hypothetical protein
MILSSEELAAIDAVKAACGRVWKKELRLAWESGKYPRSLKPDDRAYLQRLRNKIGPSGLSKL